MTKKKILIAPNSFKECADSVTIAKQIQDNLDKNKNIETIVRPISDGGDGLLNVCKFYFGGEFRYFNITTPYDDSLFKCPVLYCETRKLLCIESAEVLGLKKVPLQYRKPLQLSSKGLGELLKNIQGEIELGNMSVDTVYIGVGGTATIDMGIGMLSQMGLKLFDEYDQELDVLPKFFLSSKSFSYDKLDLSFDIVLIADVDNPLLGSHGGINIFGKQKGASNKDIHLLEKSFNHLIKIFENKGLVNSSQIYSGAGGGLPTAFQLFYSSKILYSYEFIRKIILIENLTDKIDYLITGEGAFDFQSSFGKGASVLIDFYKSKVEQIFLVCGAIKLEGNNSIPANVATISLDKYFNSISESIQNYKQGLELACSEIVNQIKF